MWNELRQGEAPAGHNVSSVHVVFVQILKIPERPPFESVPRLLQIISRREMSEN